MTSATDTYLTGTRLVERIISDHLDEVKKAQETVKASFEAISGLVALRTTYKILDFAEQRGEKDAAKLIWEYIYVLLEEEDPLDPTDQET